jgi:response regulator RpfG family c-di-GMP phosphodiesterase
MSTSRSSGINQRIADRLVAEGRITRDEHQRVVEYATRTKARVEEALIELELMNEADLLKFIATTHNTRFVSTERLSKAVIEPRVLQRVPVRLADLHGVFPVLHDEKASSLSVVTADPDNEPALHELRLTANVKEVRALAARPAAVRAAIAYHYRGDRTAFVPLLRPTGYVEFTRDDAPDMGRRQAAAGAPAAPAPAQQPQPTQAMGWPQGAPQAQPQAQPFAQQVPPQGPQGPPPGWQQPAPVQQPQQQPAWGQVPQGPPPGWQQPQQGPPPGWQQPQMQQPQGWAQQPVQQPMQMPQQGMPQQGWGNFPMGPQGQPNGPQQGWAPQQGAPQPQYMPQPQTQPQPSPPPAAPPQVAQGGPAAGRSTVHRTRSITPTKVDQFSLAAPQVPTNAGVGDLGSEPPPGKGSAMGLVQGGAANGRATSAKPASVAPPALPVAASAPLVEALNVLVSLLENGRPDLRGHSSMVARLTRKTCERIGLSPLQTSAFTAAAYLHDLGKMGAYHLTALNVAEYEGHRVAAGKGADLPVHLMESVGLLPETKSAISSMYERYDGQGIPNGQAGKDIPLGARILAVADTYADLTQNPRNPYRKILRPFEACEVLGQYRATIFDPNIVDIFRQSTTGEDMRAKLLSDRHEALIVDPDPEETTVLELRLIEHGFEVKIARTVAQAQKILAENEIDAVVSEIDLDTPDAGLTLRAEMLKDGKGKDITWVVLTGKTDRQTAQRAFDLGVDDIVLKPVSTDIFAAKLRQLIERRPTNSGGGNARGVSGSLTEMSLPDMVQILWHGRKTCALRITTGSSGGEIDFDAGAVVDAQWNQPGGNQLRGEDAFYKMLTLAEGDFRVDPAYKPSTRSIQASPEALLLEGMRRLDEASF